MTRYRNASLSEMQTILGWANEEGWNPGVDDAQVFYETDPDGFFVAVDAGNTPIGAISVVNHTDDFAFLGLYLMQPEFRGQGIGLALWTHALAHAGTRCVGLDGVEAQQQNYASSGFAYSGATTRYSGPVNAKTHPDIRPATRPDFDALIALEAAASGAKKEAYLQRWFVNSDRRMTFVFETDGACEGMCTIRVCQDEAKIGPLIAKNADVSKALIEHAAAVISDPVMIDVPQSASGLADLCLSLGLQPGFQTARMYRGQFKAPPDPFDFFAVTTLELG